MVWSFIINGNKINNSTIYNIDHRLITAKLEHYGVRGSSYDLVSSFLSGRRQITVVGGEQSSPGEIGDRSVPQGSNVGNVLFLVMMNDLPHVTEKAEFIMYADDICAIVAGETDQSLAANVVYTMEALINWFTINGMQVNIDKTNLLSFSLHRSAADLPAVIVQDTAVPYDTCAKFVGFHFDTGLQWHYHIDSVCAKLNGAFYAISRLVPTLSRENLLKAYYGYFQSALTYGIELWGLAADRERPFLLQKRMVRRMMRAAPDEPARALFLQLGVLTAPCLYVLEVAKYVRQNLAHFTPLSTTARLQNRRKNDLTLNTARLAKTEKTVHIMGPKIYNKIPDDIRESQSYFSFNCKLKKYLSKKAYYSVDDYLNDKF
ncbi:uncharacterized protein LOC125489237 [Plutella xylostella]|uniref:uncharacterized protein LOC125489237 n=1 Tax=Plutella xylostella TaxID=51655 RepID=UPI002032C7BE|nr:uncharacterized protein LOC125489237 [Plutella xylostella]